MGTRSVAGTQACRVEIGVDSAKGQGATVGDVVELVELFGPAVFKYLVKIEKARTSKHAARRIVEPMVRQAGQARAEIFPIKRSCAAGS